MRTREPGLRLRANAQRLKTGRDGLAGNDEAHFVGGEVFVVEQCLRQPAVLGGLFFEQGRRRRQRVAAQPPHFALNQLGTRGKGLASRRLTHKKRGLPDAHTSRVSALTSWSSAILTGPTCTVVTSRAGEGERG